MAASLSDIIAQNTVSNSGVRPADVPSYYSWYTGKSGDNSASGPPSGFTSVTSWGQVYQEAGGSSYYNPNATVDIANAKTYVHLKTTGEWVLVQDQATSSIDGGHFVNDFAGNAAISMNLTRSADGTVSMSVPPDGYNDHFWPTSRGVYPADAIDGVYVQMDMKASDPNLDLVANIGADWWRSADAPFVDGFGNNPGVGMNNWVKLSTEWTTVGYYSVSTAEFQANPPPSLVGSGETPPVTGTPDTTAPIAPTIAAFTPDTGVVGDSITTASDLTSVTPPPATSGPVASPGVTSEPVTSPPVTSPPVTSAPVTSSPATDANHSVNGSNRWEGFGSIPGFASTRGTIELWNNLNNVTQLDGANFGAPDYLGGRHGFASGAGQSIQSDIQPAAQQNAIYQRPIDLMTQYSATSVASPGMGFGGVLRQADLTAGLVQTLTKSH